MVYNVIFLKTRIIIYFVALIASSASVYFFSVKLNHFTFNIMFFKDVEYFIDEDSSVSIFSCATINCECFHIIWIYILGCYKSSWSIFTFLTLPLGSPIPKGRG